MFIGGELGYQLLRVLSPDASSGKREETAYRGRSKLEVLFGKQVWDEIKDRVVIDFGCGFGATTVEIAQRGARCVIGIDIREWVLAEARKLAKQNNVDQVCHFETKTDTRADLIMSLDSFEHFSDPASILQIMDRLLKPDGRVLISFGPTWYHPYGGHRFSPFPWAHVIFTEKALLRWRSEIHHEHFRRFSEVDGGLNRMTIRRFENVVGDSPFQFASFDAVPIHSARPFHSRLTREFLTSIVRCTLIKKAVPRGMSS
ncbi:MAG TPA: class I SAM-dependent methyltransferase [Terriglobales bacterium]|nr:class I SAM-dependent methyltransferase [Terriglobales bacterium]